MNRSWSLAVIAVGLAIMGAVTFILIWQPYHTSQNVKNQYETVFKQTAVSETKEIVKVIEEVPEIFVFYEEASRVQQDYRRYHASSKEVLRSLNSFMALKGKLEHLSDNELLDMMTYDGSWAVRWAATCLAADKPSPAFDEALKSRLKDKHIQVRDTAVYALSQR